MLPLGPITSSLNTTYSAAQVAAMLVQPSLQLRWLFDLLGPDLRFKQDLTPLVDMARAASIDHDASRAVKRQLSVSFWRPVSNADILNDIIRVRAQLRAPDAGWLEWRIGLFRFTPPTRAIAETATGWTLTAPDLSQSLVGAAFTDSFGVPAGISLSAAVSLIATTYGGQVRWRTAIVDDGSLLGSSASWDAGTSRVKAINDLCNTFNCTPIWADGTVLRSHPIPDYNLTLPAYRFDTTQGVSPPLGPIQEEADYSNAFNQFRINGQAIAQSGSQAANTIPVTAFYENANPASPISTRKSEPRMAPPISDSKIPNNSIAQARAKIEAAKAARIFATQTLPFLPWWFGQDLDLYQLVISTADEGVVSRKYLNTKWTQSCSVQTPTTMALQRVVPS